MGYLLDTDIVSNPLKRRPSLAEPDLRIAAIALSRDLVLVTGSRRHFDRIPGLTVENWMEEPDPAGAP